MNGPLNGPVVRVDLELGDYRPLVDEEDADWHPIAYTVRAHHAATLNGDATSVTSRVLERLTLVLTNDEPDAWEDTKPATLELPSTVEGLEAIIAILDNARDYVARETAEAGA